MKLTKNYSTLKRNASLVNMVSEFILGQENDEDKLFYDAVRTEPDPFVQAYLTGGAAALAREYTSRFPELKFNFDLAREVKAFFNSVDWYTEKSVPTVEQYFIIPDKYDGSDTRLREEIISLGDASEVDHRAISVFRENAEKCDMPYRIVCEKHFERIAHRNCGDSHLRLTEGDIDDHHSVVVIVENQHGHFLTLDHAKYYMYTFPMGKCDSDEESARAAAVRELKEEIGLDLSVSDEAMNRLQLMENLNLSHVYHYKGTDVNIHHTFYHIKVSTDHDFLYNREPSKHHDMFWVEPEELYVSARVGKATRFALDDHLLAEAKIQRLQQRIANGTTT